MSLVDFCWMLTPLNTPLGTTSPAFFFLRRCLVSSFRGTSFWQMDKWPWFQNKNLLNPSQVSKYKEPKKQLKALGFLPFVPFFVTQMFWKRNYNYIKIENRLPRLMILKEVRKNKMRHLGSILTYHLYIYISANLLVNLLIISTWNSHFWSMSIPRSRDSNKAKMFTNKWPLRSWATRAAASQPWQYAFRLGCTFNWFGVFLKIWVKGGDFFVVRIFETEGLRGLKYIGNFKCSLKNLR